MAYISGEQIKKVLIEQLYKPVKWTHTNQFLINNKITRIIECGPSKVLSGLAKRYAQQMNGQWNINNLNTTSGFEKALEEVSQ